MRFFYILFDKDFKIKSNFLLINILFLTFILSAGCVFRAEHESLKNDLKSLEYRVLKESGEMGQKDREIEGRLKDFESELKRKQADLEAEQNNLLLEIQRIGSLLEESEVKSKKIPSDFEEFKKRANFLIQSLSEQVAELEKKIDSLTGGTNLPRGTEATGVFPESARTDAAGTEANATLPADEEGNNPTKEELDYQQAYQEYLKGEYDKAKNKFEEYLKSYPDSKNLGNAQYWIGECFYSQKKYEESLVAFYDVVKKYPNGGKVPAAYLKLGMAFMELGDKESSKSNFIKVVKEYPGSDEAKIAAEKIEEMK